jgi:hypothetical protein
MPRDERWSKAQRGADALRLGVEMFRLRRGAGVEASAREEEGGRVDGAYGVF